MRKTKEVLRLRFELGLGQRQIARSCGMARAVGADDPSAARRRLPDERHSLTHHFSACVQGMLFAVFDDHNFLCC